MNDGEIREALADTVRVIVQAVRDGLEQIPPELSADVFDRGIVITGGGALLHNMDARLRDETGLPIAVAEEPLSSVVLGRRQDAVGFRAAAEDLPGLSSRLADRPIGCRAARRPLRARLPPRLGAEIRVTVR